MLAAALAVVWQPALLFKTLQAGENAIALMLDTSSSMALADPQQTRLQQSQAALASKPMGILLKEYKARRYQFAGDSAMVESFERIAASGWPSILGEPIRPTRRDPGDDAAAAASADGPSAATAEVRARTGTAAAAFRGAGGPRRVCGNLRDRPLGAVPAAHGSGRLPDGEAGAGGEEEDVLRSSLAADGGFFIGAPRRSACGCPGQADP